VCVNCQYQADLFWGPVIKSFAGGVRYGTLNRLITAVNTNNSSSGYPGCVLQPVAVLPAPPVPPMTSECANPLGQTVKLLTGSINSSSANLPKGYITGIIKNNSKNCTYEVGMAAYKANGTSIDNQNLFDYKTQLLGPGQTASFVVKSPMNNDQPSCHMEPTATPTQRPTNTPTPGICVVPTPKDPPTSVCAPLNGTGAVKWEWNMVAGANQYEVDIYKSNGTLVINNPWMPASDFNCANGKCTYITTGLLPGGYYSRVRAQGTNGGCSPSGWSQSQIIVVSVCPPPSCNKPLDIGLVIDRSSTMNGLEADKRTKLAWAKEAAGKFLLALKNTGTTTARVSIASFGAQGNDGKGTLDSTYSSILHTGLINIGTPSGYTQLVNALANVKYVKNGTCIECGLRIENGQLTDKANIKAEILLSDGKANRIWSGSSQANAKIAAINMANIGRATGIQYWTIGYGNKSVSGDIDEATLIKIAGSTANYQYQPDAVNWSNSFLTILGNLCK
jgi:hypothetical protein